MIPKIIHQIWIQGCDKIPDNLRKLHENCRKTNDDFEYICWDDDKIKNFLQKNYDKKYLDLYNLYTVPAQKADFARYAILYIYGGVYLDMDMVCHKNLEPLLNNNVFHTGYIFADFFKRYLNGIIGSVPKHELFQYIFKNLFIRKADLGNVTYSTGTSLFYDSIKEYQKATGNDDVTLIPRKYLDPCNLYDNESCPYQCKDCYIAHTNNSSWSKTNLYIKRFVNSKYYKITIIAIVILVLILIYAGVRYFTR